MKTCICVLHRKVWPIYVPPGIAQRLMTLLVQFVHQKYDVWQHIIQFSTRFTEKQFVFHCVLNQFCYLTVVTKKGSTMHSKFQNSVSFRTLLARELNNASCPSKTFYIQISARAKAWNCAAWKV